MRREAEISGAGSPLRPWLDQERNFLATSCQGGLRKPGSVGGAPAGLREAPPASSVWVRATGRCGQPLRTDSHTSASRLRFWDSKMKFYSAREMGRQSGPLGPDPLGASGGASLDVGGVVFGRAAGTPVPASVLVAAVLAA